jgi:hypothetical protein
MAMIRRFMLAITFAQLIATPVESQVPRVTGTRVDRGTGIAVDGVRLDGDPHSIVVTAGQEFSVTLGNVGPDEYASPPRISSRAIAFVAEEEAMPHVPAGRTQRFRFKAVGRGRAIITFTQHRFFPPDRVVQDTVLVRSRIRASPKP